MALIQFRRRNDGYFVREERQEMEESLTELFDAVVDYEHCQNRDNADRLIRIKQFCLIRWPGRAREIITKATVYASQQKMAMA